MRKILFKLNLLKKSLHKKNKKYKNNLILKKKFIKWKRLQIKKNFYQNLQKEMFQYIKFITLDQL